MTPDQVTEAQVQQLREYINEPDATTYSDSDLRSRIAGANGNTEAVAYYIWVGKTAALSSLVDITEGGSTRRNSQAYTSAKSMAEHFAVYVPSDPINTGARRARTRAIVRP